MLFHQTLFLLECQVLGEELLQELGEDGLGGTLDGFEGILGFYLLNKRL